jgi:hypothetical protein
MFMNCLFAEQWRSYAIVAMARDLPTLVCTGEWAAISKIHRKSALIVIDRSMIGYGGAIDKDASIAFDIEQNHRMRARPHDNPMIGTDRAGAGQQMGHGAACQISGA